MGNMLHGGATYSVLEYMPQNQTDWFDSNISPAIYVRLV
jgi:hypothetical protein